MSAGLNRGMRREEAQVGARGRPKLCIYNPIYMGQWHIFQINKLNMIWEQWTDKEEGGMAGWRHTRRREVPNQWNSEGSKFHLGPNPVPLPSSTTTTLTYTHAFPMGHGSIKSSMVTVPQYPAPCPALMDHLRLYLTRLVCRAPCI